MPANDPVITYSVDISVAARLVSDYSFGVIRKALTDASMSAAKITSTLRFPAEQAAIMHRNAKVNLAAQYRMYGATGDAVLKVFEANRKLPDADVIALMAKKIEDLLKQGRLVSRHVVDTARYRQRNVIDIGVNSTRAVAGSTFNLHGLTKAFNKLQADGYIAHFIDETNKSNSCWHIEVVPNAKKL